MFAVIVSPGTTYTWFVGQDKPDIGPHKILSLEANDIELEKINIKFRNVPICDNSCCWAGDMAKFLFDNL